MLNWDNTSEWVVLIVDDEPDNLEIFAEVLDLVFGMTVHTARNGVEALAVLESIQPTLILCDLSMPQMDGWETRNHIRANPVTKHIPVLAVSAHVMVGDKERALAAGFDGYVTKPLNISTLIDDLKTAMAEANTNRKPHEPE